MDRVEEENRAERIEPRKLWRRLSAPTPDDPFGPVQGFADSAIRTAKWGKKTLDLADIVGNGVAKSTLM